MKDNEARNEIRELENSVKEIALELLVLKKHPPFTRIDAAANYVSLKEVVLAIVEHLGLEIDYEEPITGHLVLSKKEE